MTRHLSEVELMDLLEKGAGANPHLAECPECRARLAEAEAGWRLAQQAKVPEPSPLYWEAFRRRVGSRLERERVVVRPWQWAGWLAAATALVVALGVLTGPSGGRTPGREVPLPAWSPPPPSEEDPGLLLLEATAAAAEDPAPVGECPDLATCVMALSEEESTLLAEALKRELSGLAS